MSDTEMTHSPAERETPVAPTSNGDAAGAPDGSNGTGECSPDDELPGPYGQNQAAAEQDREKYEATQQPDHTASDGIDIDPDLIAEGQPVTGLGRGRGTLAQLGGLAGDRWVQVPPGLVQTETRDVYTVMPFGRINLLGIVLNLIVAIICAASLYRTVETLTLIVFCMSVLVLAVLLVTTRHVTLVFDKTKREMRVEQTRMVLAPCRISSVVIRAPFDELHSAGFDGTVGAPGDLYIDVADTRVAIAPRVYESQGQLLNEVMPWRAYIAQLRGLTLQDLQMVLALLAAANEVRVPRA